jgi:hypothetical protein
MSTPQYATPGWGTDTYTLTCYGAAGSTPATQSKLNTTGFNASDFTSPSDYPPANPLAIGSFTTDGESHLAWTTTNSTASTVCTITDEYGGVPYNQAPIGGMPARSPAGNGGPNYYYPYFASLERFLSCQRSVPAQNTDTITLTCSDPTNGTAVSTLTLTNPGCII